MVAYNHNKINETKNDVLKGITANSFLLFVQKYFDV